MAASVVVLEVQFIKSFKDRSNVYFLTEFLGGGDLFFAIRALGLLTKAQQRAAEQRPAMCDRRMRS